MLDKLKMAAGGNGENTEKRVKTRIEITPGCQVWCKTSFNDEYQGIVTGYDREHKVIFIKCKTSDVSNTKKNTYDIIMINLNHVTKPNFRIVALPETVQSQPLEYDLEKINKRYQNAIGDKMRAAAKVGVNVSEEAQLLFNSIAKYFPDCRWHKDNIVIMDDVHISPPYKPENCVGEKSLDQVRKMVERFYNDNKKESTVPL